MCGFLVTERGWTRRPTLACSSVSRWAARPGRATPTRIMPPSRIWAAVISGGRCITFDESRCASCRGGRWGVLIRTGRGTHLVKRRVPA